MNVLKRLTKRNLTLNKKRTIVTIIGIVLSTALIVCVSGMVTSFQKTLVNGTIQEDGNYHAYIKDMSREDILALENNRHIEDYYVTSSIGYAKFQNANEYKPYLYIEAYDEKALQNFGVHLEEGRMPENSHEIVIPSHLIKDGESDKKIGDTITLAIGERYILDDNEKVILNQKHPYHYSNSSEEEQVEEHFVSKIESTYTIVGIMDRPSYGKEPYSAPGYTCITYQEKIEGKGSVAILYKHAKDYAKNTKEIAGDTYGYTYNNELLRWLGVSESDTMTALYIVAAIVILIIIVSSVFVIKNSFAISITEKYKMFGMLRSVGATSKQIKKNVLYEGFILGLIAIPLGILCGVIAIVILVFLINLILGEYLEGIRFVYSIPFYPILLSIVLASVTIYFSTIFTAKKASRITAIEAIRSNQDIKIKRKKLKTPKIIKACFKTGGVIAFKNLKRNKKKYRTTVISIVVSVFVFISLSSFIDFGFKMANVYYQDIDYNMNVFAIGADRNNQTENLQKIANHSLVERYSFIRMSSLNIHNSSYLSDYGRQVMDLYKMNMEDISIEVVSVGDQEFKHFLKEIGLNNSSAEKKGILIDEYIENINKKKYIGNLYNLKNNDILEGTIQEEEKFSIEIIRTNKRPMGLENVYSNGGFLVVSDSIMNEYFDVYSESLYLNAKDASKMSEELDNIQKENKNIMYSNIEEYIKANNSMVLIISIFLYGFITVISLIGITNIFNTITTNMNLRSKEFAMLKSIGMTKKEFNRMIRLESIFYGTKALLFGIPLGLCGSYLIYLAFKEGLEMGYIFPIKAILIAILFVAIMIGIIMKYSLSKINKQNIMDTIRNDNI